jgi:hypothetical protein
VTDPQHREALEEIKRIVLARKESPPKRGFFSHCTIRSSSGGAWQGFT